ncbi:MAG: DUF5674 family protein [Candidatus Latescibacterota bacterium]|jgi:hypothetical protein
MPSSCYSRTAVSRPTCGGANYYPGRGPDDCLEYTALINIRPSQDNPSMEILEPAIRDVVRELVFGLIGQGEEV